MKKKTVIAILLPVTAALLLMLLIAPSRKEASYLFASQTSFSSEIKQYEYLIINSFDVSSLINSVNALASPFEKTYLLSLIEKRKGNFTGVYELLYPLLKDFPSYYPYYDELVFAARSLGRLDEIKIVKHTRDTQKYASYLQALCAYHLNDYSKAALLLKGAKEFEPLYLLSFIYRGLSDYDSALTVMNKAENIANNNTLLISRILISKGSLFLLSGNSAEAAKLYKQGYTASLKYGDKREEIKALINFAILDDQEGNVTSAQEKLKDALNLSNKINDYELQAISFSELGVSYTYSGNIIEARKNYEESYNLFRKLNHKERLSNLCANIGALYNSAANYSAALNYYNEGLKLAGGNILSEITNLQGLGDVYSNLSNYSKSLDYYERAKELSVSIKNTQAEIESDLSIGTLFFNINKPVKALQLFTQVMSKAESDPYILEDIYFKTGIAYSAADSLDKGTALLTQALSLAQSLKDNYYETLILAELSGNYCKLGQFERAERFAQWGISLAEKNNYNQLSGLLHLYYGNACYEGKNFDKALKYYNSASSIAINENDYSNATEAWYRLAKLYNEAKKDYPSAEKYYLKAAELADRVSESLINNAEIQISHFSGLNNIYNELTDLYLKMSRNEEALMIIERSRSRNTLQNLTDQKINSLYGSKEKLNHYYDLKWMVESGIYSGSEYDRLLVQFEKLKNEIAAIVPGIGKERHLPLNEIKNNLDTTENIITVYSSENKIWFFRINSAGLKVSSTDINPENLSSLMSKISPLYSPGYISNEIYLNQDLFSFNTKAAYEFYRRVIEHAVKDIPSGEKIIFSLPAEMSFLPLEFLVTSYRDDDSPYYYNDKTFLVDNYAVSYSPSASIYILQKELHSSNEEKVLLVGDPQIDERDFALSYRGGLLEDDNYSGRNIMLFPLKYSEEEINGLNSILDNGTVFLSDDATERNFKENASGSGIIHLSTHSFLFRNQPLIVFSKDIDEKEDGFLETGEIHQLKLNTDLVVLSSCRSGQGTVDKSEGVIGMQKSFFEAGAKSIIVSLWDVNDKYTALFMQSFYRFISEGQDKSEALRKAKIYFREHYSANPYYWSAFILSGDISGIKYEHNSNKIILYVSVILLLVLTAAAYFYYSRSTKRKVQYD